MTWGAPYLLGRLYFSEPAALRDLALATVSAALAYVPFCLWEIRMSPQLHAIVYGLQPFGFGQAIRFGGYRPSVFMTHGLMLGMLGEREGGTARLQEAVQRTERFRRRAAHTIIGCSG